MPRPKNNPDTPAAPKNHVEAVNQGLIDVSDIDPKRPDNPTFTETIDTYENEIRPALEKVHERRSAAREMCTLQEKLGQGSQDQIAWARFNLPRKTRKGSEESVSDEVKTNE